MTQAPPTPAIVAQGLRYSYEAREAVAGISFGIAAGSLVGLLGPNGSGKSTTFKMLSTQLRPTGGEAWIAASSVRTDARGARAHLGVAFQSPSLDPWLTIEENLEIHGRLHGLSLGEVRSRSAELLKLFGLLDRRKQSVKTLSGGLARRAELAKTLLPAPQILLLDEPTTGLDPGARADFWQELRRLHAGGLTLLVATHLLEEAELCDELLILAEGKLIAQGRPSELKATSGHDVLIAEGPGVAGVADKLRPVLGTGDFLSVDAGRLRLETNEGSRWFEQLRLLAGTGVESLRWGKPTLGDVYFRLTGKEFI